MSWRVLKETDSPHLWLHDIFYNCEHEINVSDLVLGISAEAVRKLDSHNLAGLHIPTFHHLSLAALHQNF